MFRPTKKFILVFLAVLPFAFFGTHKAYAQGWELLILALSTIPSLSFFYATQTHVITKPVKKSTGETVMTVYNVAPTKVNSDTIAQNLGKIPQNQSATAGGPFYLTLPPDSYNKSGATVTISGDTLGEFLDKVSVCPSNVCTFGGNVSSMFTAANRGLFTSTVTGVWTTTASPGAGFPSPYQGAPYGGFTYINGNKVPQTVYVRASVGPVCGDGYTYNSSTYKCDLSNILAARSSGATDGVCIISGGVPDPFDKDCLGLRADNKLSTGQDVSGNPMTTVADPLDTGEVITSRGMPEGGTVISRQHPPSNGSQQREDTEINPQGIVGATSNANYPTPNPPAYPGDPGGTTLPGAVGQGTTAPQCGGAGQPACTTRIVDGQGKDVEQAKPGDPVAGIEDGANTAARTKLEGIKDRAVLPVSTTCPSDFFSVTVPFPAPVGDYRLTDNGLICQMGDQYGPTIRLVSIALGFVSALFIVLKA